MFNIYPQVSQILDQCKGSGFDHPNYLKDNSRLQKNLRENVSANDPYFKTLSKQLAHKKSTGSVKYNQTSQNVQSSLLGDFNSQ